MLQVVERGLCDFPDGGGVEAKQPEVPVDAAVEQPRRLLWVTEQFTKPGGGARVSLLRHAKALQQEGYLQRFAVPVRYIGSREHDEMVREFGEEALSLVPARKPWWPPTRSWLPGSWKLRYALLRAHLRRVAAEFGAEAILCTNYLDFPTLATALAEDTGVPLSMVVYDLCEEWPELEGDREMLFERTQAYFDRASRVWFVSRELRTNYENRGLLREPMKASILLPMSTLSTLPAPEWSRSRVEPFVLAFAGQLHSREDLESIELCGAALQRVGGKLLLVVPEDQRPMFAGMRARYPGIWEFERWRDTPKEALRLLSESASALLVPCGFHLSADAMAGTSFPSKLLDYCQTGLPTMILAGPSSAVMRWAESTDWPTRLATRDLEACVRMMNELQTREGWERAADYSKRHGEGLFSPVRVHTQFRNELALSKRADQGSR